MRHCGLVIAGGLALAGCGQGAEAPTAEASANEVVSSAGANAADVAAGSEAPLALAAGDPALTWGPCPSPFPAGCELTVLHGDPAKPNADVFLRVPGGYVLPPHSHSSAERMVLVGGRLEVQYQGAPAATLQAGQYAYGPAGRPHSGTCAAGAPCTLFIAFEGPVDVVPFAGAIG